MGKHSKSSQTTPNIAEVSGENGSYAEVHGNLNITMNFYSTVKLCKLRKMLR